MPPAAFNDLDINAALLSLPSCARCRSRRVKCDSLLPTCANCARSGHECTYRDHALGRVVSRPYLATLVFRAGELRTLKQLQSSDPGQKGTGRDSRGTATACIPVYSTTNSRPEKRPDDCSLEDGICFWGPSSFYARLAKTLVSSPGPTLQLPLPLTLPPERGSIIDGLPHLAPCYSVSSLLPKADLCLRLMRVYHGSVETFYPVFGWDALARLVHDIYRDHHSRRTSQASTRSTRSTRTRTSYGSNSSSDGQGLGASASVESVTLLCLLLAVTFRLLSLTDQRLGEHAKAHYSCFQDMQTRQMAAVHSAHQPANVQALQVQVAAVQCIYLLLGPSTGTAWQIIGYAQTLYGELPPAARMGSRMLHRTLVCLEMQTAHSYGRPTVFVNTANNDLTRTQPLASFAELVYGMAGIWFELHSHVDAAGASAATTATASIWLARVHADLQGWIHEWNSAINAQLSNLSARQAEHLRTSGSLLHSQCLFELFGHAAQNNEPAEATGRTTKSERKLVAARLINDAHSLYYRVWSATTANAPHDIPDGVLLPSVFPFFWTHVHSIASACLFLLAGRNTSATAASNQTGCVPPDGDSTIHKGLMLLLALDQSQTLFRALSNLQTSIQHDGGLALSHDPQ